uniref:Bell all n=1 Tax=Rhipicephalus appendiculatus TaxID=34631 RepID=A0A131YI34_RHIAP
MPMDLTRTETVRRHAYRKRLTGNFWRRWTKEYLLQLRSAHFSRKRPTNEVKTGDIVIVQAEKLPRQMWKLARVLEVYRGADGHVRSCKIRQQQGVVTTRPIQKLYSLELNE